MQDAWDTEAEKWGIDPRRLRDGVVTRARLGARGSELAQVLREGGSRAHSEVLLADVATGLFGQLDVIVDGGEGQGLVVDLKTGRDGGDVVSSAVHAQLSIYAHLFRVKNGALPARVLAYSLRRGIIDVPIDDSDLDDLISRIVSVINGDPGVAVPDPDGCRYCPRRLRCDPQWAAASGWSDSDCVQGRILKAELAETGARSVQLDVDGVPTWVSGLRDDHLVGELASGGFLRVVRARRLIGAEHEEWQATRETKAATYPTPVPISQGRSGPNTN